jgi:transcriptional regulator with XRE-family HTH domain
MPHSGLAGGPPAGQEEAAVGRTPELAEPAERPLIGARLRAARLARRQTVAEVAAASGMTKGFLSRLERDRANASVAALIRLCHALDLAVGSLFEPPPAGEVVRRGEYPPISFGGSGLREFLLTPRGEHRLQAIVTELEPDGGSGAEPHTLPGDVEFVYVLDGLLRLDFPGGDHGESTTLGPGDALTFTPGIPHLFRSVAQSGTTRVLWVISPALPDGARLHGQSGR